MVDHEVIRHIELEAGVGSGVDPWGDTTGSHHNDRNMVQVEWLVVGGRTDSGIAIGIGRSSVERDHEVSNDIFSWSFRLHRGWYELIINII